MSCKSALIFLLLVAVAVVVQQAEADVLKGSCVWGAVDYKSNCNADCKRMGFKGGHCGSFANVNCWCET